MNEWVREWVTYRFWYKQQRTHAHTHTHARAHTHCAATPPFSCSQKALPYHATHWLLVVPCCIASSLQSTDRDSYFRRVIGTRPLSRDSSTPERRCKDTYASLGATFSGGPMSLSYSRLFSSFIAISGELGERNGTSQSTKSSDTFTTSIRLTSTRHGIQRSNVVETRTRTARLGAIPVLASASLERPRRERLTQLQKKKTCSSQVHFPPAAIQTSLHFFFRNLAPSGIFPLPRERCTWSSCSWPGGAAAALLGKSGKISSSWSSPDLQLAAKNYTTGSTAGFRFSLHWGKCLTASKVLVYCNT